MNLGVTVGTAKMTPSEVYRSNGTFAVGAFKTGISPFFEYTGVAYQGNFSAAITLKLPTGVSNVRPTGVNKSGIIVGNSSEFASFTNEGYVWSSPAATPVKLKSISTTHFCQVQDVNDKGQMVGQAYDQAANATFAVFWENSTSVPVLLKMPAGHPHGYAHKINNNGVIIGGSNNFSTDINACYWTQPTADPQLLPLGSGILNVASDLDANGMVAGYLDNGTIDIPVMWANGGGAPTILPLLAGQATGRAIAIHNGVVVGECGKTPVVWRNGVVKALKDFIISSSPGTPGLVNEISDSNVVHAVVPGSPPFSSDIPFAIELD